MRMNRLELIIVFVGVALAMAFHFIGSFILCSGVFISMLHQGNLQIVPFLLEWRGVVQVEAFIMMCGGIALIVGLVIALIIGKMFEGKCLAGLSIAYLTVATSLTYLSLSEAYSNRISAFLPHILLSNSTLSIAWFIGYFIKKRSPKRLNEYPV